MKRDLETRGHESFLRRAGLLSLRKWRAHLSLSALGLLLAACLLAGAQSSDTARTFSEARDGNNNASSLLEIGSASKLAAPPPAPSEIKIVSYNIRFRAGEDLQELIALLKNDPEIGGAAIIGLQEVDRNRKRTKNANTVRALAEGLGMHYVWAAPPNARPKDGEKKKDHEQQEEETGVALLSPYPMTDIERLVLAHEGPNRRRRVAIGATLRIGQKDVRVYSLHGETRIPAEKKVDQWRAPLDDLKRFPAIQHVIVVGDFNSIKEKEVHAVRKLYTDAGFTTPFRDEDSTFKVLLFDYKLDWVWLRGLTSVGNGIDKQVGLSDHWPLWVKAKLL